MKKSQMQLSFSIIKYHFKILCIGQLVCLLSAATIPANAGIFKRYYPDAGTHWTVSSDTTRDVECFSEISKNQLDQINRRLTPAVSGITQVWGRMFEAIPFSHPRPHPGLLVTRLTIKNGRVVDQSIIRNTINYPPLEKEVQKRLSTRRLRKFKTIQCLKIFVSINFSLDIYSHQKKVTVE
jgi:hypothetical protein